MVLRLLLLRTLRSARFVVFAESASNLALALRPWARGLRIPMAARERFFPGAEPQRALGEETAGAGERRGSEEQQLRAEARQLRQSSGEEGEGSTNPEALPPLAAGKNAALPPPPPVVHTLLKCLDVTWARFTLGNF